MTSPKTAHPLDRRDFLKLGLGAAAGLALGNRLPGALRVHGKTATRTKVLILGMDGLDPHLLEVWMKAGKLPTFAKVIAGGGDFRRLATSLPPQSPVAWSNFIAGTDPGGHGIFDFVSRDPQTYIPTFSPTETTPAKHTIRLGRTILPLSGGEVRNLRRGEAFWQVLERYDVPATVFKIPSNYPPVASRQRTLSGMNTPDIKGTYGLFSYYTNEQKTLTQETGGGGRVYEVYVIGNRVEAKLPGPYNSFKQDSPEVEIDFQVFIDPREPVAKIVLQGQEFILREKEWSGWKRLRFGLIPTQGISGICLFYLKEVRPKFKLYVSPIHIDPASPALPISTPGSYAQELERRFGPFFTKGLPADTSALDNEVLDEAEFLALDEMVLRESEAMLDYELERFDSGLLFYYFSSTDQRQHMFWRLLDSRHPAYDAKLAERFGSVIEDTYVAMDRILERTLPRVDKDTVLIIMSDHGFNSFRRSFNVNTWLFQNGYHALRDPRRLPESQFFDNTLWGRTKAYGIGLNGLCVNQRGRERDGVVAAGAEKDNLLAELVQKLEAVVDPLTGERPILKAFIAKDTYRGPHLEMAPDIVLGFNQGYRISGASSVGGFSRDVLEDNRQKWSGDHMSAPETVQASLVVNRKVRSASPALYDLTATILGLFGAEKSPGMIGSSIFG
jgi:predicted AlkP superfamily phosphohydrolase/phosphomutase